MNVKLASGLIAAGVVALTGGILIMSKTGDPYRCSKMGRALTDQELIVAAYELEQHKASAGYRGDAKPPDGFPLIELADVSEQAHNCCSVYHVDEPEEYGDGWLDRLIHGQRIHVRILLNSENLDGGRLQITYALDQCGRPNRDRRFMVLQ